MKRVAGVLIPVVVVLVLAAALAGLATAESKGGAKPMTVTGEILDLGCYLGHGAFGEKHRECAVKCASTGMPIGVLGKGGVVYLLTLSHDDAAPFNQCKEWAGTQVTVTGPMMQKGGMKAIEVTAARQAAPAAK